MNLFSIEKYDDKSSFMLSNYSDLVVLIDNEDIERFSAYKWKLKDRFDIYARINSHNIYLMKFIVGQAYSTLDITNYYQLDSRLFDYRKANIKVMEPLSSSKVIKLNIPEKKDKKTLHTVYVDIDDYVTFDIGLIYDWYVDGGYVRAYDYDAVNKKARFVYLHRLIAGDVKNQRYFFNNGNKYDCRRGNIIASTYTYKYDKPYLNKSSEFFKELTRDLDSLIFVFKNKNYVMDIDDYIRLQIKENADKLSLRCGYLHLKVEGKYRPIHHLIIDTDNKVCFKNKNKYDLRKSNLRIMKIEREVKW